MVFGKNTSRYTGIFCVRKGKVKRLIFVGDLGAGYLHFNMNCAIFLTVR